MKLIVELDLNTIRALAILGVDGMQEHVDNYNRCHHRWRNNIDTVAGFINYINEEYPQYTKEDDLMKFLAGIVRDIEPLLTDEQRLYSWNPLHVHRYEDIIGISSCARAIQDDTFDITYYRGYLKYMVEKMDLILQEFNEVHA